MKPPDLKNESRFIMLKRTSILAITLFIFIMILGCVSSQEILRETSTSLIRIIEYPNKPSKELYGKIINWDTGISKPGRTDLKFLNEEEDKISGQYVFMYSEGIYEYSIKQDLTFQIKDDLLRVEIKNPMYKVREMIGNSDWSTYHQLEVPNLLEISNHKWQDLVDNLVNSINNEKTVKVWPANLYSW